MIGLTLLLTMGLILVALDLAALRWGVDTRDSAVAIR